MDNTMHHWFDVVLCTLIASVAGSIAYVLAFFPPNIIGELVHSAFVVGSALIAATLTHYLRKWLESRDKETRLKLKDEE